jgi:hypothetical protein
MCANGEELGFALGHRKVVSNRVKLIGGKRLVLSNERKSVARKSILGHSVEKSGEIYPVDESVTYREDEC